MTGFKLTATHDLLIADGDFVMLSGVDLLIQTVECVVGTNRGEWFLDEDEGITFSVALEKHPDMDMVKSEINDALLKVDEAFVMEDFTYSKAGRKLQIHFIASNDIGQMPIDIEF